MTTDTALALLAEAEDAICILSDSIRDRTVSEYYSNLCDRITALLDSGIKDAGDDVVEPYVWEVCGEKWIRKEGYDTLLSAYKRVQQEKKTVIDVYEGNLRDADKRLIFWQERAEKAEAEIAAMHKAAEEEAGHELGLWPMGALAVVARLKSERDEFRKDAERYRWLRDKEVSIRIGGIASPDDDSSEIEVQCLRQIPEVLDSAIDSARNK